MASDILIILCAKSIAGLLTL